MIRTNALAPLEDGFNPGVTNLEEEGFDYLGAGRLVGKFRAPLMSMATAGRTVGFVEVAKSYLELCRRGGFERDDRRRLAICSPGAGQVRVRNARCCRDRTGAVAPPRLARVSDVKLCAPSASIRRTRSCSAGR